MTNIQVTMVYGPMLVMVISLMVLAAIKHIGKNLAFNFFFYAFMVLCWLFNELTYFNTQDIQLARFLYDMKLPFVAFTALGVLMYVLRFYGLEGYYSGPVVACLSVCPLMTTLLAVTSSSHELIRTGFSIVLTSPFHIAAGSRGPWFWVHAGYCYVLILISLFAALAKHGSLPRHFKLTSWVLITGMSISLVLNCMDVLGLINITVDFALVGVTVCTAFMYAATRQNQGMDFINRARVGVFNDLADGMLILDYDRNVRGFNDAGRRSMVDCGLDDATGSFDQVLHTAAMAAHTVEVSDDVEGGTDYYIEERAYNIREKPIRDNRQRVIGAFVIVLDVTDNRKLIRQLEKDAGMDARTGLHNRMHMDAMLRQLDSPEHYPLAVISGDMNGLKQVNDTYGHQQGDVLLRLGADILASVCPPSASIGRMGGDEFLVLIPYYTEANAQALEQDF